MITLKQQILEYPWSCPSLKILRKDTWTGGAFMLFCFEHKTIEGISRELKCNGKTVLKYLYKFSEIEQVVGKSTRSKILQVLSLKECTSCQEILELHRFGENKTRRDGIQSICLSCQKVHNSVYRNTKEGKLYNRSKSAKYRSDLIQRTPAWVDLSAITAFYLKCPIHYEVDHIIPLNGRLVSGLHVLENLQYLTPDKNREKSNKYDHTKDP